MCEPVSIITAATAVIGTGISIASEAIQASAQNQQAEENEKRANEAAVGALKQLGLRQMQERQLASQTIYRMDQQARAAEAQHRVASGESGVAGMSVDMVLGDIERQRIEAGHMVEQNTESAVQQIEQDKQGVRAGRQSQIASMPSANPWAVGIRIGGHAAQGASRYMSSMPTGLDDSKNPGGD